MKVFVEVCSTQSGGTAALASTRGPHPMSGLNMAEAHASVAGQSDGDGHSVAIKCARAMAQAQNGREKVQVRVSNPITANWHVQPWQEVEVDQRDQPHLHDVEYHRGKAPTGGGASYRQHSPRG